MGRALDRGVMGRPRGFGAERSARCGAVVGPSFGAVVGRAEDRGAPCPGSAFLVSTVGGTAATASAASGRTVLVSAGRLPGPAEIS